MAKILLLCVILAGAVPVEAQRQSPPLPGPSVVTPGDALQVTVWRKPELSGEFLVGADSSISHPFYQEVKVAFLPLDVVLQRVVSFLEESGESNPRVRIEPRFRVQVAGEVRQPRLYTLGPETTISYAVLAAGGPTDRAKLNRVRLIRGGREQIVDFTTNSEWMHVPVQSGDQIVVERDVRVFRDYVLPTASITTMLLTLWMRLDRLF